VIPSQPKWSTNELWLGVGVFVGFSSLDAVLIIAGVLHSLATLKDSPLLWVAALPVMAASRLGLLGSEFPKIAFLLNSMLYGGMGWFAWRMWRLMRRKREPE
jgi:hypothetical protein